MVATRRRHGSHEEGPELRIKDLVVSLSVVFHLKNRLRLRLRAILADPTLRLQRPQDTGSEHDDRLRVLLAVKTEGELTRLNGRCSAHTSSTTPESRPPGEQPEQ